MMNKKLLTAATVAGLAFGAMSVGAVASAQDYENQAQPVEIVIQAEPSDLSGLVLVQDVEESETEGNDAEGRRGHRGGCDLDEAAEAIGIDEAELRTAIENGATIADVAAANNVDVDAVIDAMVDAKAERIAEKVDEGRITQEEADAKLAQTESRIAARVNGTEAREGV